MCGQVTLTEGHPKKEPINPRPLHSSARNHVTKVLKPASSKSEWGITSHSVCRSCLASKGYRIFRSLTNEIYQRQSQNLSE